MYSEVDSMIKRVFMCVGDIAANFNQIENTKEIAQILKIYRQMNFPKMNTLEQNIEELEHSQHSRSFLHVTF